MDKSGPYIKKSEQSLKEEEGTLAIDLGSSTTIVAFQKESDKFPQLIDLSTLCRAPGEIPSIIWHSKDNKPYLLVGQQVINSTLINHHKKYIIKDFKRWIGAPQIDPIYLGEISPEEAGGILIKKIWEEIPINFKVKRLVLTAPVETYRAYRNWLTNVCQSLEVREIALVDEPTAAAMGAGLPPGSKLLVVDIGGSTIDMSIVALEGGEGKAAPLAQLVRFDGQDLEGKSKQILRTAKVLGKAGLRLGGRDIDRWIANHLVPELKQTDLLLDAAEKLKFKLSIPNIKDTKIFTEDIILQIDGDTEDKQLRFSKQAFENLLIQKGFLESIKNLFNQTLKSARINSCNLTDLNNVVLVGGGAQIPLIKSFLERLCNPIPLLTPPPVEAIAIGALKLTPGVQVKDVLQKGISLRCWNQKSEKHVWHPLYIPGQPWPTSQPLEIILAASIDDQSNIELILGEPSNQDANEVIYINGLPTIQEISSKIRVNKLQEKSFSINLNPPGKAGCDCLKLKFSINENCELEIEGIDLRTENIIHKESIGIIK